MQYRHFVFKRQEPTHSRRQMPWGERLLIAFCFVPGTLIFAFNDWLLSKSFLIGAILISVSTVFVLIGVKRYWDS